MEEMLLVIRLDELRGLNVVELAAPEELLSMELDE